MSPTWFYYDEIHRYVYPLWAQRPNNIKQNNNLLTQARPYLTNALYVGMKNSNQEQPDFDLYTFHVRFTFTASQSLNSTDRAFKGVLGEGNYQKGVNTFKARLTRFTFSNYTPQF